MELDAAAKAFVEQNRSAAMITVRRDGTPHAVRVGIGLVDGKIWSSGTQSRLRTRLLRRDPRATLFVFDNQWAYLSLECRVNILDGPEAPEQNLRLFRTMQQGMAPEGKIIWYGVERDIDDFLRLMKDEGRLIYEFEPLRAYGMYGEASARR